MANSKYFFSWYTLVKGGHNLYSFKESIYSDMEYIIEEDGTLTAVPKGNPIGALNPDLGQKTTIQEVIGGYVVYVSTDEGHNGRIDLPVYPTPTYDEESGVIYDIPHKMRDGVGKHLVGRVIKTNKGKVLVKGIRENRALPAWFPVGVLIS